MNSSSWQTSECVRLEDCSGFVEESPLPAETTTEETTTVTLPPPLRREPVEVTMTTLLPLSQQCPVTTLDVGGRSCDHDTDCPTEQRCCRALIATLGVSPQRCACKDPLAVWSSCGSLCPKYCSQPAVSSRYSTIVNLFLGSCLFYNLQPWLSMRCRLRSGTK